MKLRHAVLAGWEIWGWLSRLKTGSHSGPEARLVVLRQLISYGLSCGRMSRKVKPVNVDELAAKWLDAIVVMSTAHDKDAYDAADARADDLMGPILTAPVKQVREFYSKLRAALRADKRVPMVVWMGFEAWGEAVVAKADDDKSVIRLKNKLAAQIAELVELPIQDQIPEAIKRALRWRDPETLEAIKETLEKGAKPKLVGRQSCLFLEAGKGDKKVQVML